MEFEELGHRGVDVHAAGGRGTPPSGDEVSDIDLGHLNRVRQLARGALQLAQPTPYEFSNFDGALQGESSRHVGSFELFSCLLGSSNIAKSRLKR
jgi:hypothetical protein